MPFFTISDMAKKTSAPVEKFTLKPYKALRGDPRIKKAPVLVTGGQVFSLTGQEVEIESRVYKRGKSTIVKRNAVVPTSEDLKGLYDSSPAFVKFVQAPEGYKAPWTTK